MLAIGGYLMCKISIVVPVYNVEKYISECIESLLSQSYKDFEIILVDDGSTDASGDICDKFANENSCITVIHKNNQGLGLARNTGIEVANGEYITFIDSDDYVDNDLLKELYESIISTNADTCLGGFKRVDDNKNILFKSIYDKQVYRGEEVYNELLPRMIGSLPDKSDSIRMSVWNVMYSMKIIKDHLVRFPSEREYISEDIMFDIEYYKYSTAVSVIDSCLYNYRLNTSSLTLKYKEDRFDMVKKLYHAIKANIINKDIENEIINRLSRQFFIYVRMCIQQENIKVSGKTHRNALANIKVICTDQLVQEIISEYPIKRLQLKPKVFIYLIKYKISYLLYIAVYSKLI